MRLKIKAQCCVDEETRKRNTELSVGYPEPKGSGGLAIIGGGPSVSKHEQVLRDWNGDIWAINGAVYWCMSKGIEAALVSVDPDPILKDYTHNVQKAVLAAHCDPLAYQSLTGADVYRFEGDLDGPTTAVAVAAKAIDAGYSRVTYFGCECSYADTTHVYEDEPPLDLMRVECGGVEYLTKLEFAVQAERLSEIFRKFPHFFIEESGGLLRAMIEHGEYDVLAVSRRVYESLKPCPTPAIS